MTGIFFTARLGSTRLSQKHLIEVYGKTFIEWLVGRFVVEFQKEIDNDEIKIFITTSVEPENEKFESLFKESDKVNVFYGNNENIPLRHLECAKLHNITNIISVDGDDILCSAQAARILVGKLKNGSAMVQSTGLPLGMNVTGYKTEFLEASLKPVQTGKLETGWGRIFDIDKIDYVPLECVEDGQNLRMTLDYKEDAIFFEHIISYLKDDVLSVSDERLINIIIENNWSRLNEGLNETYWANFNKQKQDED